MNKTDLLNALGNVFMDIMEAYEIEDEDVIADLVDNGLSSREINALGLFDKKLVRKITKAANSEKSCSQD